MAETEDLYHCEQCHSYFYRKRVDEKRIGARTECPKCGNPWAWYWPDTPEGYNTKKPWPDMCTAYCD